MDYGSYLRRCQYSRCDNILTRKQKRFCSRTCSNKARWETSSSYRQKMSQQMKERWEDPEFREQMSEQMSQQMKELWQDSGYRWLISQRRTEQLTRQWQNQEYREQMTTMSNAMWDNSRRKRQKGIEMKERWEDPEYREQMTAMWEDPEFRKRFGEIASDNMKKRWEDPGYREQMSEKRSQQMKEQWEDPEYREQMSGPNNPRWNGGSSFEPYRPEFNESLKALVRARDCYRCAICGVPENGCSHDVHHIDYDKCNNNPENLICLCHRHHSMTNSHRDFWQETLPQIQDKSEQCMQMNFLFCMEAEFQHC